MFVNCRRTLKYDVAETKGKLSAKEAADLQEKRNMLSIGIRQWREVQLAYTPAVASLILQRSSDMAIGSESMELAEDIPLFFPSSVPVVLRETMNTVVARELRLRKAQAEEALEDVCRGRRMITGLTQFKKLNICGAGNKPNTRMRNLHNRLQRRIQRAAKRYQAAREAVQQLEPGGIWSDQFRQLEQSDIRGPGKQSDDALYMPNGRHEQSWIWSVGRSGARKDTEEEFDKIMRAEWAKMRARRDRWEEEYRLVVEEMRRTVVYLEWKAAWWRGQCWRRNDVDLATQLGLKAYAERQARMLELLAVSCIMKWVPALSAADITVDWPANLSTSKEVQAENDLSEDEREDENIFDSYDIDD